MRCFNCPLYDLLDSVMLEPEACILASCAELLLYCILMHKIIAVTVGRKKRLTLSLSVVNQLVEKVQATSAL